MRLVAVQDLRPIQSRTHGTPRPALQALTDAELLEAVRCPALGDFLTENTRSGVLVDGNGRADELLRRVASGGLIAADTTVPVTPYTPDLSMFPDLD